MNVSVWDTFVKREDNRIMHFDILVSANFNDRDKILEYGTTYLSTKKFKTENIISKKCQFCHIESASKQTIEAINKQGFDIVEIENCD